MKIHNLATLFPPMSSEEFSALQESIRDNGLRVPIVTYEGAILDGVNRHRACVVAKVEPRFVELKKGTDPLKFVLDINLHRRHLNEAQRSMIAARIANMAFGDNQHKKQGAEISAPTVSQTEAAKMLSVDRRSVQHAAKVLAQAAPELVEAVDRGRVAVSAASQISALPKTIQNKIAIESDDRKRGELVKSAKESARSMPKPAPITKPTPDRKKDKSEKTYYTVEEWKALSAKAREEIITHGFEAAGQTMNEQTDTSIEWARHSHNTVTGCLHDCPYCYARDIANRFYEQKFVPVFHPARLAGPGSVKVPKEATEDESYRNIFANSMSDLFGQWVPSDWIEATIQMAWRNPDWNFLTLTKFPQRAADFEFPDNWWMGTTVDAQARVANAEKAFAKIKCKTKWLSVEPLLEPLTFKDLGLFQWVVIGGASFSMNTPEWVPPFEWVSRLHNAAKDAGCAVYHKTNLYVGDKPNSGNRTNLDLGVKIRPREFPWLDNLPKKLPDSLCYLKGMKGM